MLLTLSGLILLAFFACRTMPEADQMLAVDPVSTDQTD